MPPQYASRDFMADPATFMDNNIIVPHHAAIGVDQASGRIHEMCLVLGGAQGKQAGRDLPVYILTKWSNAYPADQGFFAYWCPYNQNETLSCNLGNGARYMFTATMDGCSFGIGSQVGGGCRVAHANEGRHGGNLNQAGLSEAASREQQRLTQRNSLWAKLESSQIDIIQPRDYMLDIDGAFALKSTTFGIHDLGRPWSFYTQRYWRNGNKLFLREVTQQI